MEKVISKKDGTAWEGGVIMLLDCGIKVAGPIFPKLLLEAGDGTRIWFWHNLRCGDSLLKDIS